MQGKPITEDLTDARKTFDSLTLLEALASTAPLGFGFVDRDLRIVQLNDTLALVAGLPAEQQLGRPVAELMPGLWAELEPIYRHVLDTGEAVVNREMSGQRASASGGTRYWLTSHYPLRLEGEVVGVGVVVVDITERHHAEEFRAVVMDNMAEGLFATDGHGDVTFMNAAATEMLGWTLDELRGKPVHDVIHFQRHDGSPLPEEESAIRRARVEQERVSVASDAFTRRDGRILPVGYSAAPLDAGLNGVVVVFRDATQEQADRTRVQRALDSLTWVGRIREALDEDRLVLHSQPIVPLSGGEPSEELLLRMIGRDGEIILPGSFLPAAEKFGLILEIDRWVVVEAVRLAASGRRVQANLSAESIADVELLSLIARHLRETGADPARLVFEITETALMSNIDQGQTFAEGLVALGCGIALDDFGTGFGSFTYLKRLPVAYLKVDIEFVRHLASSEANQHLVKAIVSLARAFGHQTIAEGVEDEETLTVLREYGVDFAQGFHLGRPAPTPVPGAVPAA